MSGSSQARTADELPFDSFYAENKNSVLRAVIAATGDLESAEDFTAEAFSRAYENWAMVSLKTSPAAWIVRSAVNLSIDRHRQSQVALRVLPDLVDDSHAPPPALPIDPALLAAIKSLPERQRQVLALRILLGLSGEQTAQELSVSVGAVGTHLHRALATLRTHMSALNNEDQS